MQEPRYVEWTAGRFRAFFMSLIGIDERYMKTDTPALSNATSRRGGTKPPDVGLASCVSPEAIRSGQGVSSDYVPKETYQWFVLRATYGRSEQAYDALVRNHIEAYIPKHYVLKQIDGKKKRIEEPLLPNLVFVHATKEAVQRFMKEIPYLRFYRDKTQKPKDGKHPPLTIVDAEMMNFMLLMSVDSDHIKVVNPERCRFKKDGLVRVIGGPFRGVIGHFVREGGQQRVMVKFIDSYYKSSYIPSAFVEEITDNKNNQ